MGSIRPGSKPQSILPSRPSARLSTASLSRSLPGLSIDPRTRAQLHARLRSLLARRTLPVSDRELVLQADLLAEVLCSHAPAMVELAQQLRCPHGPEAIHVHFGAELASDVNPTALSLALGIAAGLEPFQYCQQNDGRIVARIESKPGAPDNTNATAADFLDHTDDQTVAFPYRAEFISLFGIQNDCATATGYTPVTSWIHQLSVPELDILCDPNRFRKRWPLSFGMGERWETGAPILWLNADHEACISMATYAVSPIDVSDVDARDALATARDLIQAHRHYVTVRPGTALVFNNNRGTHCRDAIDGARLALRTYFRSDLSALRAQTRQEGYVFDLTRL